MAGLKEEILTFFGLAVVITVAGRKNDSANSGQPASKPERITTKKDPPKSKPRGFVGYVRRVLTSFSEDDCTTYGAALAYYSVFSLAPLLLLVIAVVGLFLGRQAV